MSTLDSLIRAARGRRRRTDGGEYGWPLQLYRLMLTLVLCYLPALMLLVVIPLFLTLLDGLFG